MKTKNKNIAQLKNFESEETLNYSYAECIFSLQKFIDNSLFGFAVNNEEDKKIFLEMFEDIKKNEPNIKDMAVVIKGMLEHLLFYFREV